MQNLVIVLILCAYTQEVPKLWGRWSPVPLG